MISAWLLAIAQQVEIFLRDNWWQLPPDQVLQTSEARLLSVC